MKLIHKHIRFWCTLGLLALGISVQAQFILQAPNSTDENNYRWYEARDMATVLGTNDTYEVFTPGIYFAKYDGTLCGKNATSYFVVTWCGDPDDQVTLDISQSVPAAATVSWDPAVSGDPLMPTVTALYGQTNIIRYTPSVSILGNTKDLPSFTVICLQKPFTLVDDLVTTDEDVAIDIDMLANDIDIPNVGGISNTDPANGTVTFNDGGTPLDPRDDTFTYTPDPDFNGTDSFTYTLSMINSDGTVVEQTATITIDVVPVNDDPIANDDSVTTQNPNAVTFNVLANDTDVDGDVLVVDSFTQPANGTLVNNGNGDFAYTPDPGFSGTDTFTYIVSDGNGGTDTATVTVVVQPPDIIAANYAVDDDLTLEEDTQGTFDIIANDAIPADAVAVVISDIENPLVANVIVNADNTVTIIPEPDYVGTLVIGYEIMVTTPTEVSVSQAVLVVEVTPVQDVFNDMITLDSTEPEEVVINILDNDTFDPASDVVIISVGDVQNGTATINDNDNTIRFTVEQCFEGTEIFTYTVSVIHSDGTFNNEQGSVEVNAAENCDGGGVDPPGPSEDELLVHQLVTPNGDGRNDFLRIYGIENFPDNTVTIYNRSGIKVFETKGYDNGANVFRGMSNSGMTIGRNNMLPYHTYFIIIDYVSNGSTKRLIRFFELKN